MDSKNLLFCLAGVAIGYFIATHMSKKETTQNLKETASILKGEPSPQAVENSPATKVFNQPPTIQV